MGKSRKNITNTPSESTAALCRRLAEPAARELGLFLWDVRFIKEGATWYLRIFIDCEEREVNITDCEIMSRRIDKLLDEADPIGGSYVLEVSSPGIERELTRPEHFEICAGLPVLIRLIRPDENGLREVSGILDGLRGKMIAVTTESGELLVDRKSVSAVRLAPEWEEYTDEI